MQQLPIVGRDSELATIADAFGKQEPHLVSISGIAGIGKSTLVACAMRMASERGMRTLSVNLRDVSPQSGQDLVFLLRTMVHAQGPPPRLDLASLRDQVELYEEAQRRVLAQFRGNEQEVGEILRVGLEVARAGVTAVPGGFVAQRAISPELLSAVVSAANARALRRAHRLLNDPGLRLGQEFVGCIQRAAGGSEGIAISFDEYEHVNQEADIWLRRLLGGQFGPLPNRVITLIAGRLPLGRARLAAQPLGVMIQPIRLGELTTEAVVQYLRAALEPVGMVARAKEAAELLGPLGRLPVLLEKAAEDPRRLVRQLCRTHHRAPGGYDWGGAFEDYSQRLAEDDGVTVKNRYALHAIAFPRRLNDARAEIALSAVGVDDPTHFLQWIRREDLMDPQAPVFTMYEPIRLILTGNLRQHDPALARLVHVAMAEHFMKESLAATEPANRMEARREGTYHEVLAGDVSEAVMKCLQAVVNTLPWVYLELPQWVTLVQEIETVQEMEAAAADTPPRERDDLARLARLLTVAWDLLAPHEADAIQDAISLDSDPLLYRLLELDRPQITNETSPYWVELFLITAERLSEETEVSLRDAEVRLRNLYRGCEALADGQELLTYCVAYELAEVFYLQGRIDEAVLWSRRLVDVFSGNAPRLLSALAYASLGSNLKRASDFRSAMVEFEQSIRCFRQLGGDWSSHVISVQLELANCHLYMGETADAMALLDQLGKCHIGARSLAEVRHRLGWQLRLQGDLSRSVQEHEAAIEIYENMPAPQHHSGETATWNRTLRAKAQHSLANTLSEMHDLTRAEALYAASITYFETHGLLRHAGIAIKDSIPVEYTIRGIDAASDAYKRALALLGRQGNLATASAIHIAEAHLAFARVSALERRVNRAIRALDLSRGILDQLERGARNQLEARWHLERAFAAALSDNPAAADEYLPRVVWYAERIVPRRYDLLAQAAAVKAVVIARSGKPDAGLFMLQDARRIAGQWNPYLAAEVERIWSTTLAQSPPPPTGELLDVYEASGALRGAEPSTTVHLRGLWHRSFHCWVTDTNSDEPLVLFQRRGANKRDFPNCLDISVAGHYRKGEGIEGGLREVREELGLVVSECDVIRMAERRIDERLYNGTVNREWQDIYWLPFASLDLARMRIGYPEVEAVVVCRLDLVKALLRGHVSSIAAQSLSGRPGAAPQVTEINVTAADFITEARHYLIEVCHGLLTRIRRTEGATPGPERDLADGSVWRPMAD